MTDAGLATWVFRLVALAIMAFVGWHLWLAYGIHQTPTQFFADIERQLADLRDSLSIVR